MDPERTDPAGICQSTVEDLVLETGETSPESRVEW
jgi:hypothetical protein